MSNESEQESEAILGAVPILARLSRDEIKQLALCMREQRFVTGYDVIRQGDAGTGFYIIKEGKVKVTRLDKGTETQIAVLKSGDYFGEAALLNNSPRGATVSTMEPCRLLFLDSTSFTNLFSKDRLNVQFAKRKAISAEKTNPMFNAVLPSNVVKTKDSKTNTLITNALLHNILFVDLTEQQKRDVIAEMYMVEVKAGTNVITQGEIGDNLYVVQSGDFDIFVGTKKVTQRGPGTYFGELALLYNSPRAATVTATSNARLWAVDRFTFRRIVNGLSEATLNAHISFLKQCDVLNVLADYERLKLAEALELVQFRQDEIVFRQGFHL
jgi:CRP-like cAMP-binding protein